MGRRVLIVAATNLNTQSSLDARRSAGCSAQIKCFDVRVVAVVVYVCSCHGRRSCYHSQSLLALVVVIQRSRSLTLTFVFKVVAMANTAVISNAFFVFDKYLINSTSPKLKKPRIDSRWRVSGLVSGLPCPHNAGTHTISGHFRV